jgi:hypothetical protein
MGSCAGRSQQACWLTWIVSWTLLTACGRVGVELVPIEHGSTRTDGGAEPEDGGGTTDGDLDPVDGGDEPDDAASTCVTPCSNEHGSADCSNGTCVLSCAIGYADCDGNGGNGCEANTSAQQSCGMCERACENDHGLNECVEGVCTPSCAPGYADCDGQTANGCETSLSQTSSCGGCDLACANAHGTASCVEGACVPSCAAGFDDCDGDPRNGCEANVASDPLHCGACGRSCRSGIEVCMAGMCMLSPCASGRGECDGNTAMACETDLSSSDDHCGFCGNACTVANGSGTCVSSSCAIESCTSGFGNCDGTAGNGCEVPLRTSSAHCGACGRSCTNAHGTTACVNSNCAPTCGSGFGDCDTNRQNGCEQPLDNVNHCGACGRVCPANGGTPGCNAGVCTTTCSLSGTYALKVTVPVSWPGTSLLSSGSGTHTFWARAQLSQNGSALTGSLTACANTVPDFSASSFINEDYGFTYPNTIFDRTSFTPTTTTSFNLGSASPGASLNIARSAIMFGVTLNDPVNDAWPSVSSVRQVDSDGDGKPGVTGTYKSSSGYDYPPTNNFGTTRADRGYMAVRVVFSGSGTLNSCTAASGSVSAQDVNYHTVGCRTTGGRDCSTSDRDHLNQNGPDYRTSAGTYTLRKIADGAGCAAVRSAAP